MSASAGRLFRLLGLGALVAGFFLATSPPVRAESPSDETPTAVAVERAPRAIMWVQWMDDLSWWKLADDDGPEGWFDEPPATTLALLAEAGRAYAPFLVANAQALMSGDDEVVCEIDGDEYRQAPFRYQGKCLQWIREQYDALAEDQRARVDALLAGTGCEALVA